MVRIWNSRYLDHQCNAQQWEFCRSRKHLFGLIGTRTKIYRMFGAVLSISLTVLHPGSLILARIKICMAYRSLFRVWMRVWHVVINYPRYRTNHSIGGEKKETKKKWFSYCYTIISILKLITFHHKTNIRTPAPIRFRTKGSRPIKYDLRIDWVLTSTIHTNFKATTEPPFSHSILNLNLIAITV